MQAGDAVWGSSQKEKIGAGFIPDPRYSRAGTFEACATLPQTLERRAADVPTVLHLAVAARVDQSWAHRPHEPVTPNRPPQTHWINARTNPSWRHVHPESGREVQGQLDFISAVVLEWRLGADGATGRITGRAAGNSSARLHARARRAAL